MKKLLVVFCFLLIGCVSMTYQPVSRLKLKGSDTMLPLARFWAEVFMIEHPRISVYVEGGGTATGMAALANGDIDICLASRPILPDEAQKLAARYGAVGVAILVAKDALSLYVNLENPVKNLSIEQVRGIFGGNVTNWSEFGGEDAHIVVLNRQSTSGTYAYFQEHVLLGQDYSLTATALPTTKAIVEKIAAEKYAIGYGGIAYESDVAHCSINGVEPTYANVLNDAYPLTRYLYLYTVNTPAGLQKEFVNWVLSEHGQDIVKWVGYFPIWPAE